MGLAHIEPQLELADQGFSSGVRMFAKVDEKQRLGTVPDETLGAVSLFSVGSLVCIVAPPATHRRQAMATSCWFWQVPSRRSLSTGMVRYERGNINRSELPLTGSQQ